MKDEEKKEDTNLVLLNAMDNIIKYSSSPKKIAIITRAADANSYSPIDIGEEKELSKKHALEIIIGIDFYSELNLDSDEKERIKRAVSSLINQKKSENILATNKAVFSGSFIKEDSNIVRACSNVNIGIDYISVEIKYFCNEIFNKETPELLSDVKETIRKILAHFYQ